MRIIDPTFEMVDPKHTEDGVTLLRKIEYMARISHRSEDRVTDDSYDKFLRAVVIQHGDWSVVEHASATVLFRVDRGVTHELVRHRLFSFTQESTRFVNGRKSYPDGLEFILPENIQKPSPAYYSWLYACEAAEKTYLDMLDWGTRPQEARSVLPNSLASTIAVTGNLRNWRHFLLMRTSKETHPDFRRVTIPLLAEFKKLIPILFDDVEPMARQIDNLRKPR
jgi:thymidylate synthase (FAD)